MLAFVERITITNDTRLDEDVMRPDWLEPMAGGGNPGLAGPGRRGLTGGGRGGLELHVKECKSSGIPFGVTTRVADAKSVVRLLCYLACMLNAKRVSP